MNGEYYLFVESLHLEPKTRQQIPDEYGISVNTFKTKLKRVRIELPKGLIFPATQKLIYHKLGLPAKPKKA
jgi:hypothetical protein